MSLLANLFRSSIGRKFLMAGSGLVLTGFAVGHLVGNLQIFSHPDKINGYAHFLQSLGPALWVVRLALLAAIGIHIWAAVALTLESKAARGPQNYGVHKWLAATWASRTMRLSGLVVAAFVVYHILHFTVGVFGSEYYKNGMEYTMTEAFALLGFPVVQAGAQVHDVYSMIFIGFGHPLVSGFYILATGLLAIHLWHGADSMFQTLGLRSNKWATNLRRAVTLLALAYFLGNLAIPGAILTGIAKPAAGTPAAAHLVASR
ncbi:MAG: succinate dehydrogenase cytochrome b subunit [Opitutaceae bacterium]|jgi:succinate dehydrogenase / fumarate reductase cytochrome b subunit|nr:succinate dehydrogenase cytochrome b subunit [Opitutaceae bacterium]